MSRKHGSEQITGKYVTLHGSLDALSGLQETKLTVSEFRVFIKKTHSIIFFWFKVNGDIQ